MTLKEYNAAYYQANKARMNNKHSEWLANNPGKQSEYNTKNRKAYNEYQAKYRREHNDEIRIYNKIWRDNNREQYRATCKRRWDKIKDRINKLRREKYAKNKLNKLKNVHKPI